MMMNSHNPDLLPPQLARWLTWPVAIVGASALEAGSFPLLIVAIPHWATLRTPVGVSDRSALATEALLRQGGCRTEALLRQGYRVGVHDEDMDCVPCGYDKDSPNPGRPRFHRGPLQMAGWLLALVYNAVADLSSWLPDRFVGAHVRTLRRTFLERPGRLYCTPESLIVYLDPFRGQEALIPVIDFVNGQQCRIPWLENRRLVLALAPAAPARQSDP